MFSILTIVVFIRELQKPNFVQILIFETFDRIYLTFLIENVVFSKFSTACVREVNSETLANLYTEMSC